MKRRGLSGEEKRRMCDLKMIVLSSVLFCGDVRIKVEKVGKVGKERGGDKKR
jgi:hypothetical protein